MKTEVFKDLVDRLTKDDVFRVVGIQETEKVCGKHHLDGVDEKIPEKEYRVMIELESGYNNSPK